jgi:Na+/H+ antiporter NhaA
LKGHVASFFFLFYNFNSAGIVTNEIFKKYIQDKRIFFLLFFLRPKDFKKVLMEGNTRENKKKLVPTLATLHYSHA